MGMSYMAASDIIEYLMTTTGGGSQDSEHRALRAAAGNAYRDVVHSRDWKWHETAINLDAHSLHDAKRALLPADCKNIDSMVAPDRNTPCVYVTMKEYLQLEDYDTSPGSTIWWTLHPSAESPGRMELLLGGKTAPIHRDGVYLLSYRRKPEPLRYFGYERACRDGSVQPEGAVKRYGTPTVFPEGPYGVHAFTAEEIIGVPGSRIGTPPVGAKETVSDFLDIGEYMLSSVLSGAEAWYARLTGQNVEGALTLHQRDLRLAMESDGAAPFSGRRRYTLRYPEGVDMPYSSIGTARQMGYYGPTGPDTGVSP